MNWEAVGAVGEVVGAVAVVVTLLYLASQTRANTRAVEHAMARGVQEDANAWRFRIIESAEVTELLRTGLRDPQQLDANDRYRFRMLLDALVFHWQHAFHADQQDIPKGNITRVLGTPGGVWYWERAKSLMTPDFVEYVDQLLRE